MQQYTIRVDTLQWIFALVITALLLLSTLAFFLPPVLCRKELVFVHIEDEDEESEDFESRPLLDGE